MTLDVIFDRPHWAAGLGAPGRIRTRDPLLRRCRTSVRGGRPPGEITAMGLTAGHGVRPRWCRLRVSARPVLQDSYQTWPDADRDRRPRLLCPLAIRSSLLAWGAGRVP